MYDWFEKKEIFEILKYGTRPILQYVMKFPLFLEGVAGAEEFNSFIEDLVERCRAVGVANSLLPYLIRNFEALSMYEQKFKFKPYKYSLDFCILKAENIVAIEIRATLSQNGRCIMKNRIPIFWNTEFRYLCADK